jgi:hypothetical protein
MARTGSREAYNRLHPDQNLSGEPTAPFAMAAGFPSRCYWPRTRFVGFRFTRCLCAVGELVHHPVWMPMLIAWIITARYFLRG